MEIKLKRHYFGETYTIGRVYIDTVLFSDSLEDTVRDFGINGEGKIKGKTAIPKGKYEIIMSYSPRFKQMMPLLVNVPYFAGILIHDGKDENSTEGCLIVGLNTIKGELTESKAYYRKIRALIMSAKRNNESVFITVE
jgi:hypothetical protein